MTHIWGISWDGHLRNPWRNLGLLHPSSKKTGGRMGITRPGKRLDNELENQHHFVAG